MKTVNRHPKAPKMLNQVIIEVPEALNLPEFLSQPVIAVEEGEPNLPQDLRDAMVQSAGQLHGSEAVSSYKLMLCLSLTDKDGLEALIFDHSLDWEVLGFEDELLIQAPILEYMSDVEEFDEEGESTGFVPVTDLTGILSLIAGHKWEF